MNLHSCEPCTRMGMENTPETHAQCTCMHACTLAQHMHMHAHARRYLHAESLVPVGEDREPYEHVRVRKLGRARRHVLGHKWHRRQAARRRDLLRLLLLAAAAAAARAAGRGRLLVARGGEQDRGHILARKQAVRNAVDLGQHVRAVPSVCVSVCAERCINLHPHAYRRRKTR
jgi:hypothetical protein